jgi:hypothetical protein
MKRLFQNRNNKLSYYLNGHFKSLYPKKLLSLDIEKLEKSINRFDELDLNQRLDYYNKISSNFSLEGKLISEYDMQYWRLSMLKDINRKHGVYFLDLMEYARFFPQENKLAYLFGDITQVPEIPSLTKSRPVSNNNNSILMKFDKVRHFYFVKKDIPYHKKKNILIWRGAVYQQHRIRFMEKFFKKSPLIDIGDVKKSNDNYNKKWRASYLSIDEQLQYKFILSIEGFDVATNTKWIMSSNSLCFMTKPKFETWFMEGKLIPDFHYVLINDDYSNLEEKIHYYIDNPEEAKQIIINANNYVKKFKSRESEDWLQLKVLERYFNYSGQPNEI